LGKIDIINFVVDEDVGVDTVTTWEQFLLKHNVAKSVVDYHEKSSSQKNDFEVVNIDVDTELTSDLYQLEHDVPTSQEHNFAELNPSSYDTVRPAYSGIQLHNQGTCEAVNRALDKDTDITMELSQLEHNLENKAGDCFKKILKKPSKSVKKVNVCIRVDTENDSEKLIYDLLKENIPIDETSLNHLETSNEFLANQSEISENNSTLFRVNTTCFKVNKKAQNKSGKVECMISNCNVFQSFLEDHERVESLSCQECRKILISIQALNTQEIRKHENISNDEVSEESLYDFLIEVKKRVHSKPIVQEHKRIMNIDKELLSCQVCGKIFILRKSLDEHKEMGHCNKSKRIPCTICDKKFSRNQFLKEHMINMHSEKTYLCSFCKATFASPAYLRRHKNRMHRTKTISQVINCTLCEKKFSRNEYLKRHMINMHSEKTYICSCCKETFTSPIYLSNHKKMWHQTNTISQVIMCTICEKKFSRNKYLKRHMINMHSDKTYQCSFCEATFASPYYLSNHRKRMHQTKLF